MKQYKRIATLLLTLAMALGLMAPAFAANATVTAGSVTAKAGENAAVEVSIADNPGFAFLKIEVSYDQDKLSFNGGQNGDFSANFNTYKLQSGNVNLLWDKSNGDVTGDGVLAVLSFTVKSGASGTADVSLKFVEANTWELQNVQMSTVKGVVTVGSGSGSGTGSDTGSGSNSGSGSSSGSGSGTAVAQSKAVTAVPSSGGTVRTNATSAKAGERVTVTVMPEAGKKLSALNIVTATGQTVAATKVSDTEYTFLMPAEAITVSGVFAAEASGAWPYRDVNSGHWFYGAVAYVTEKGLMNGISADLFSPDAATTRAMVIMILARLHGADVNGASPWYAKAVDWAVSFGVSDGTTPNANITREQLVTMLYRYAQLRKLDVSKSASIAGYPDAGAVHDYAQDAMRWAVGSGLVNGIDGRLEPTGDSTRAQIATLLMRFCETYGL